MNSEVTEEQVALITAASQGIGRAVATHLSQKGWKVVLLARSESIVELGHSLGGFGLQGSITDARDLERTVQDTLTRYGRIDGVVHNKAIRRKASCLV